LDVFPRRSDATILAFVLNGRSAEIRPDLTNTAKPILEKGTSQVNADFATNLP
jgi:hypothetical protein